MSEAAYLDWNATTPPHPEVLRAMERAQREAWGNPSSVHAEGRRARALLDETRERLAALLELDPRDVILTGSGTEANNLALAGARGLALTRLEHPSITRAAEQLARRGVPVEWVPVPVSGRAEPAAFEQALARLPQGSTLALMAANHETGVLQPVAELARLATRHAAKLHVDAVQACGKQPREDWLYGDSFSVAAHKIRGPKGIGALAFKPSARPQPVLVGGAQERGLRPGTLDPAAAAGFGAALERVAQGPARYAPLSALRDRLERAMALVAEVNGSGPRLPHVSNLSFQGFRGDELVAALDLHGIRVSSGSACSAGTSEPSPVLQAMLGEARARSALRVSLGEDSSEGQIERLIAVLSQVLGTQNRNPSRDA